MQSQFFRQIDVLQSFLSHGTKSFAILTFSVKLIFCKAFFPMGKKALHDFPIFRQIDGIMQNCGFYVNLTKNRYLSRKYKSYKMNSISRKKISKAFCPMGKKALQKINLTEKISIFSVKLFFAKHF